MADRRPEPGAALASVERSRAGRDIIVNLYAGAPASLRAHLRDREFLPLIEARTAGFVGRGFVVDEVRRHLDDPTFPAGYVVIRGEPGIGKTALAAHLVVEHGWLHHFTMASANIRSAEAFLGNVCAQLVARYGLDVERLPEHAMRDSGFLLRLLDDAARTGAAAGPLVLVLDALDEAEPAPPESGANRLLLPPVLPAGVHVVVTSREQHDDQLYADAVREIVIADDDPRNLADLRAFAEAYTGAHAGELAAVLDGWRVTREGLVDRLVDASEGNFQYLRLVLAELIAPGHGAGHLDAGELPRGLVTYYRRHWAAMRSRAPREYERLQRPVLCHLATAREPVDADQIARWTGLDRHAVVTVLREWRPFLNEIRDPGGRTVHSIYHRSFADFLDQEEGLAGYHAHIADAALAKVRRSRT